MEQGNRPRGLGQRLLATVEVLLDLARIQGEPDPKADEPGARSKRARLRGRPTLDDVFRWLKREPETSKRAYARAYGSPERADSGPLGLPSPPVCRCEHFHCGGACLTWAQVPASCGSLFSCDRSWGRELPCRPAAHPCKGDDGRPCEHVHCERCGVGMGIGHPYIWYAHVATLDKTLAVSRKDYGWLCRDCTPADAADPEPTEEELRRAAEEANRRPRGCSRCAGDVMQDGDVYRCVGLTAEDHLEREAVELLRHEAYAEAEASRRKGVTESDRMPWVASKPPTQREVDDAVRRIRALDGVVLPQALPSCGWSGSADDRGVLYWRIRRCSRGRQPTHG